MSLASFSETLYPPSNENCARSATFASTRARTSCAPAALYFSNSASPTYFRSVSSAYCAATLRKVPLRISRGDGVASFIRLCVYREQFLVCELELIHRDVQCFLQLLRQLAGLLDLRERLCILRVEELGKLRFYCRNFVDGRFRKKLVIRGVEDGDLIFHGNRRAVLLFEYLDHAAAGLDTIGGFLVEVGGELHKRFEVAELRELKLDAARDALHRLGLRGRADTG